MWRTLCDRPHSIFYTFLECAATPSGVLTLCFTAPSGLWLPAVSGITVLFSSAFGMFWTCVFGCLFIGDFKQGMIWTFS